uniref:Uncharacterized protein n=1 Tax=Zea mays TaxID=4577 RepID=B6SPY6_MAIZE|nr:hypothetical protein [Zea mays]
MADRKAGIEITKDLLYASQPDAESLKQTKEQKGIASVLNLRDTEEQTFMKEEGDVAQQLGLQYKNVCVKSLGELKNAASQIIEAIETMPKPILIHCIQGQRAAVGGLLVEAKKQKMSYEQILEWGKAHNFHFDTHEGLAAFLKEYSTTY